MTFASKLLLAATFATTAGALAHAEDGGAFNAGAAQLPPRGTYDHYKGPGATVLKKSLEAQHEPGVAQEIAPDAKQTATGGPSGGLPGLSGGR